MGTEASFHRTIGLSLKTKGFALMLAALVVQQLIVASSSLWLVQFTEALARHSFAPGLLLLYLASLILPYGPGAVANYFQKVWELAALENYWRTLARRFSGRVEDWSDTRLRDEKAAIFVKDGPQFVQDGTSYVFDWLSTGLNTALNILAVVLLLDSAFLLSYLVGLLLAVVVIRYFSRRNLELAHFAEQSKIALNRPLGLAWDNLAIGNSINAKTWEQDFHQRLLSYRSNTLRSAWLRDGSSLALSLATFVPTLVAVLWYAWLNASQVEMLLPLAVLLPRIFMILNHTVVIVYLARDWSIYKGRLKTLSDKENAIAATSLRDRIQWPLLKAGETPAQEIVTQPPSNGWVTLRGPNGAGKSTALIQLKQTLGTSAFLYPAKHVLMFAQSEGPQSTGQRVMSELQEVFLDQSIKVFLLDEWDANLDDANRARVMALLEAESRHRLIVDVRHR